MRLIRNNGADRVIDELRQCLAACTTLDIATPSLSLFALNELHDLLTTVTDCRLVLPAPTAADFSLLGSDADRIYRNRLQTRWIAQQCAAWLDAHATIKAATGPMAQATLSAGTTDAIPTRVITGSCALTTEGLGITPSQGLSLVQVAERPEECAALSGWFTALWQSLSDGAHSKQALVRRVRELADDHPPALVYFLTLYHLLNEQNGGLDEERIVKAATGIRNTTVWQKLYTFQRDGVIGALDKLDRFGGCIIADSVGLGKTFEALAIIKYYELRNARVLVLAPKRLRDNWTLYKSNDRRNFLASDRFNYDVLNHTDLSRDGGLSGDIDLGHVNWGNYDLVVIDESHNFRNKKTPRQGEETRYDRLMRRIIREGVKTRVLMLSATPVNNRLADLKNQIAFATEGDETALRDQGISNIEATIRLAQAQFNRWLDLSDAQRRPSRLIDMLGFDYFKVLDLLTIARSRKHVQKYYGITETGQFPERLKPVNIKADVDVAGEFRPIRDINNEIRRLHLAAYAPLRYVLPQKQTAYDTKYSQRVKGGTGLFRQVDREESLVQLLRVNDLKRMESSVASFALTVQRQLADVEVTLARLDTQADDVEEVDIADVDIDDPAFESLLVGRKVKVLLRDVDRVRWRQDLLEDRDRLASLLAAARQVTAARDAKLAALRQVIAQKCRQPLNPDNRKVIVFTAFADTAQYLYEQLAPWALKELGVHSALVTGAGHNQTTLPTLRRDLVSILTAFSPRAKARPAEFASDGELGLLIATDCISEGQNLQDCDMLINYDIHWNPVRIIQRFGRIDRIGSPNERIQLVNFWPNMELDEYINLEQRVSGRMVLLDISATGEENVIEYQSGNQMNDLEYRRDQLLKLQEAVLDLEDLSNGVSITDLTLNDFRMDLSRFATAQPDRLPSLPLGTLAVTTAQAQDETPVAPGVVFCLRAVGEAAHKSADAGYPLAPHYVVHVGETGAVLLPFTQAKQTLDLLKRTCLGRERADTAAYARFDRLTKHGKDVRFLQEQLAKAIASIVGKKEERAVVSLFTPGGTHVVPGELQGGNDFEVVAYLVVLPEDSAA